MKRLCIVVVAVLGRLAPCGAVEPVRHRSAERESVSRVLQDSSLSDGNLAARLDGTDNGLRTGMGMVPPPWTLEAWIKADGDAARPLEVIVGGGEYTARLPVDPLPLVVKDGRLHHPRGGITAPQSLIDQWRHVALICDGHCTIMFVDGEEAGRSETAATIIPGAIGWHADAKTAFGGLLDEVRIWSAALPGETLRSWLGRPIEPSHPRFDSLCGYYPLDDLDEETSINWVGAGNLPFHVRNGRIDHKYHAPVARAIVSDNDQFSAGSATQQLFNAVVVHGEWDADVGAVDDPVLKLRIAMQGGARPKRLTALELDLAGCTDLADLRRVHVYSTGQRARSTGRVCLSAEGLTPARRIRLDLPPDRAPVLAAGINYLLVTFDISPAARLGHVLRATVPAFELDGVRHVPSGVEPPIPKQVVAAPTGDGRVLRVIEWNIWHGGRHLGPDGPSRITELIAATRADVVTMQESYGSQQEIAAALGFDLLTPGPTANLAILSRWPLSKLPTKQSSFQSTLAAVELPIGRRLLLASWWLRYANRPGYAAEQHWQPGHDAAGWVAEDLRLSTAEAAAILEADIEPALADFGDATLPVIIGGDFNSGSDQDWTAAAARWHGGYGPVSLPTSRLMRERGFIDSFRHLHPDEVARPEGTFAVIYGHLQHSRIDYIYYRGKNLRAVTSKIVRTSPEIDFVWPSDHAAVVTSFEISAAEAEE
jgi:endonuclease/exonuclease/phosphatase (EEP) superfamily protein YafD